MGMMGVGLGWDGDVGMEMALGMMRVMGLGMMGIGLGWDGGYGNDGVGWRCRFYLG